jgi:hypothetical protein
MVQKRHTLGLTRSCCSEESNTCFEPNSTTLAGNPSPVAASAGDHSSAEEANGKVGASTTKIPYKMANYQRTDFQVLIWESLLYFAALRRKITWPGLLLQ